MAPIWEHDTSDYPDVVKVAMADGHVITYQRVIEQPHPNCLKAIDLIKIMKGHTYGGSYKGMKPFPATASREKSHVRNWRTKGHLAPLMRPTKFPEIPVSLERNTEVFRHQIGRAHV